MHGCGVAHHDVAEGLLLQLGEHIQAGRAGEVVEAVVVLQMQHLRAEDVGKAGAEHAAKGLELLRQASNPEIHILQASEGPTGIDAGGIEEILGIQIARFCGADQGGCGRAAGCIRGGAGDRSVAAVGRDEVGEGFGMFDIQAKVIPAGVGLQGRVAGIVEEHPPGCIHSRRSRIAATGEVERAQIEWQADKIVA